MADSRAGIGKHKMHLEYLLEQEDKVLKEWWGHVKKDTRDSSKGQYKQSNNNHDGLYPTE